MKIVSIEPTPSPHSMKININETLPDGQSANYKSGDHVETAPNIIQQLLKIEGVKGLYHVADFLALERHPKVAWESILPEVRSVFGQTEEVTSTQASSVTDEEDPYKEIKVFLQMYRDIPIQIKLQEGEEEHRVGLPSEFMDAVMKASADSPSFVMERKWVEQSTRYGTVDEIGKEVKEEILASYDVERLEKLVHLALESESIEETKPTETVSSLLNAFYSKDWKVRYAALDKMDPTFETIPVLEKALQDEKASIRRLATAYLGMIEEPEVLPYLFIALKDKAVTVRRTAGDCLSDLGFKEAMPNVIESLKDSNRLVRWRAAMFLFELGDETALKALKEAADDPEFEVRMQIKLAIERIEGGEEAKGSVWHQMTQATKNNQ
ncbi:conserved virulence factor C family protein [Radiobacillus kanasensis]|uniref:conserved virulence factor C family protein n=1 Tax=Radiobacillus kanasensis TaxID=2844358 RepID=UPI001E2FB7D5|nr:conserved virulence factor C family protein [Radiobacillus kanasensis]UFT98286.1 conserved virulence factor C family protein [Radiobacillus kanasensis]